VPNADRLQLKALKVEESKLPDTDNRTPIDVIVISYQPSDFNDLDPKIALAKIQKICD